MFFNIWSLSPILTHQPPNSSLLNDFATRHLWDPRSGVICIYIILTLKTNYVSTLKLIRFIYITYTFKNN